VLRDRALSVSSSQGGTIEIGGRRLSHVVDPRVGRPVPGLVEAVVVGARAAQVDAWSTALLVAGGTKGELRAGLAALEAEGLEAWIEGSSTSARTTGWHKLEADGSGASSPENQSAPDSPASAQSRRASSLQEHSRPVPPHEPFSSRPVKTTPTAMAATARQKIVAVARNVVIGLSRGRGRVEGKAAGKQLPID
jgi:hypothetical protein